jgi:hypothetical protein
MTDQELIAYGSRHLLTQRKRSAVRDPRTGWEDCKYRGPGGLKCGAGIFIPDGSYFAALEGKTVNCLPKFFSKIGFEGIQLKIIGVFQTIHDAFIVDRWPDQIESLKQRYQEGRLKPYDLKAEQFWSDLIKDNPPKGNTCGWRGAPSSWAMGISTSSKPLRVAPN